jgi:hypothetical protein
MRTTLAGTMLAAALAFGAPAGAQDPAQVAKIPPHVRAEIQTDFMNQKLHLTPEEKTKIEAINVKYADQMQPVLQGSMGPLERMRAVRKIEEAKDGEVKAALTAEQYQAYLASKDELREKIKQRALSGQ